MAMKTYCNTMLLVIITLFFGTALAQNISDRELNPHKNVRLVLRAGPDNLPKELKDRYERFLPIFEEVLRENTADTEAERALVIQVVPAVKVVGSAKTKRVTASITAYTRNSKSQYVGTLLLYSYTTGEDVNKEEIAQFLKQQILKPLGAS
jgi:hypothetical protein